jgi:hypothetical protein
MIVMQADEGAGRLICVFAYGVSVSVTCGESLMILQCNMSGCAAQIKIWRGKLRGIVLGFGLVNWPVLVKHRQLTMQKYLLLMNKRTGSGRKLQF